METSNVTVEKILYFTKNEMLYRHPRFRMKNFLDGGLGEGVLSNDPRDYPTYITLILFIDHGPCFQMLQSALIVIMGSSAQFDREGSFQLMVRKKKKMFSYLHAVLK